MPDQEQSTAAPVDWTEDGILRAVYLVLFEPADRAVLRRAGSILATQAVSSETADDPILDHLRAAAEDLRMCSRHLREIVDKRHWSETTDREVDLCRLAEHWQGNVADIAFEIEGELGDATGAPTAGLGPEEAAAAVRLLETMAAVLVEARKLQSLDRDGVLGRSVGKLADSLPVPEAAIKGATE